MRDAARRLEVGECLLEAMPVDAVDHLAVHLDEPAVRVEREARVAGRRREPLGRHVVQPEVEDRVHHPRHRDRRTGADRDEQRVAVVAEALARALLERGDVLVDLARRDPAGTCAPAGEVRAARVRGDREAVRDGDAELRHLGEADPLSAEKLATAARVLAEVEDVAHLRGLYLGTSRQSRFRMAMRSSLPKYVVKSRAGVPRVWSRIRCLHREPAKAG